MTTFAKGMIITGIVVVLLIVAGIASGVYWISQQSGPLLAKTKEGREEGRRFGAATDNNGCVAETLARYQKSRGFMGGLTSQFFLGACLRASRPTEGFCDNVPGATQFVKTANWQREQCARANLADDNYCPQLFSPVLSFCELRRADSKGQ